MGLYVINCSICHEPFLWFSGNLPDQSCSKCKGVHMTHAEAELKRLEEATEKWFSDIADCARSLGREEAVILLWPFVQRALERASDPKDGSWAKDTEIMNRFKASLGMELQAHEMIGVE